MLEIKNSFPGKEKDEAIFVFARPYGVALQFSLKLHSV
jgi:hypothetical protein